MTIADNDTRKTARDPKVEAALRRATEQRERTDRVLRETAQEREVLAPILRRAGLIR